MRIKFEEYYSRIATLPEVGNQGLRRLRSAQATIVGLGGVGSAVAFYLAQTGVGQLRLIDQDIVDPTNLHRMNGADQSHLYHPKAEVSANILSKHVPWTKFEPIIDTLRPTNADELLSESEIIVDGLDNFRTRYLVNQYASEAGTPYVFASAVGNQGHLAVFHPPETGCLECALPGVVDRQEESCESLGVTPTITGMVGALVASEASKALLHIQTGLLGRFLTIDTIGPDFVIASAAKRDECQVCGRNRIRRNTQERDPVTMMCGGRTSNVLPESPLRLDLEQISQTAMNEDILTASSTVLVFRRGSAIVSLFRSGRVLIEGVETKDEALRIAREIWTRSSQQMTYGS